MRINDAIAGVLFLAFGLVIVGISWQYPEMPGQPYGAATFPLLIGSGFILVSLVLIAKGIAEWRNLPRRGASSQASGRGLSPRVLARMALTVLLVVLYIAFSDRIGFAASSFLVLVTLFLALQVRPLSAFAIALVATVVIQQAFGVGLRVPLPRNELFSFLW